MNSRTSRLSDFFDSYTKDLTAEDLQRLFTRDTRPTMPLVLPEPLWETISGSRFLQHFFTAREREMMQASWVNNRSDDAQLAADLREDIQRELQIFARVRRRDDGADTRAVAGDGGEGDALREHAFLK